MERMEIGALASALGIYEPWVIKSVDFDDAAKVVNVHLDEKDNKRHFTLLSLGKKTVGNDINGRWAYMPIGAYQSVIHAKIPESSFVSGNLLTQEVIVLPDFLGHPSRTYSNFLRQQVALAQLKGINPQFLTDLLHVNQALLDSIITDVNKASEKIKSLVYLPTENDTIWSDVLHERKSLRSNTISLKLLLSKLKVSAIKEESEEIQHQLALQLRRFFVANAHSMENEIDQLCGITTGTSKQRAQEIKSKLQLVLPAVKHPVWLSLLGGKLKLNSHSVPLNLLISRQKLAFMQSKDTKGKVEALSLLREYFRRNYRNLKPELLLLNRAMAIQQKKQLSLPKSDHDVWQEILRNDNVVPSSHVAYKLLLAKLRSQLANEKNPIMKFRAAQRVRDFLNHNQKSMSKEVNLVLKKIQSA